MSPDELRVKFEDCARLSLGAADIKAAADALHAIERLPSIKDLTGHLAGRVQAVAA